METHHRIHDLPDEERPREKMFRLGATALSNAELLAIFLRTGTPGMSAIEIGQRLLNDHGGLVPLARLDLQELCNEHGLGIAKACQLQAAFELGTRAARDASSNLKFTSSDLIYDFLAPQLAHEATEKLVVLSLRPNGRLIKLRRLSSGTTNQTLASISEILRPVIIDLAPNFVLAHNHPSGDATPSQADRLLTRRVKESAQTMGLNFLDHVIIGRPNDGAPPYYSFAESGEL